MADTKRQGSPLDTESKRLCNNDSSVTDMDDTADPAFLSSTVLNPDTDNVFNFIDSMPAPHQSVPYTQQDIKNNIVSALMDPEVVVLISKALALEVSNSVKAEIRCLHDKLAEKDREILHLRSSVQSLNVKVDALEQYSRRNNVRISGIPESENENTDKIVQSIASSLGVEADIDISHRIGPINSSPSSPARPIIVRLKSRRSKVALMSAKKNLKTAKLPEISKNWPVVSSGRHNNTPPRIFINEDLTKQRAAVAALARDLKRRKQVDDTWVRDGNIFIKRGSLTKRVTTREEIEHSF